MLTARQYFKSIEQIAKEQGAGRIPAAVETADKAPLQYKREGQKELWIDTEKKQHEKHGDGELTPDSMSSRLIDSGVGMTFDEPKIDGLAMDPMSARVSTRAE